MNRCKRLLIIRSIIPNLNNPINRRNDLIMTRLLVIFILLVLFSSGRYTLAQSDIEKIKFSRIPGNYGLSNSNIRCILHDSKGFLWVGTEDGLNRFDGYSFKVYRNDEDDSTSLIKNAINSLFEDSRGVLW